MHIHILWACYTVRDEAALNGLLGRAVTSPDSFFGDEKAAIPRAGRPGGHRHGQRGLLDRWMKLWVPHLQRQWLAKIIPADDDDDCRNPDSRTDADSDAAQPHKTERDSVRTALAQYWGATFRPRPTDREASKQLAAQHVRPLPDQEWTLPTASAFKRLLKRQRDSLPDPTEYHTAAGERPDESRARSSNESPSMLLPQVA